MKNIETISWEIKIDGIDVPKGLEGIPIKLLLFGWKSNTSGASDGSGIGSMSKTVTDVFLVTTGGGDINAKCHTGYGSKFAEIKGYVTDTDITSKSHRQEIVRYKFEFITFKLSRLITDRYSEDLKKKMMELMNNADTDLEHNPEHISNTLLNISNSFPVMSRNNYDASAGLLITSFGYVKCTLTHAKIYNGVKEGNCSVEYNTKGYNL